MDTDDVLLELFGRIEGLVPTTVDGLDDETLARSPQGGGNPVAWLVWHLSRVQDDHVADASGRPQVWDAGGWRERFALDLPASDTGYGHGPDEVARVRASAGLLASYHAAVAAQTADVVRGLGAGDLDRVVDPDWDPPVTLGVRLMSVASDCLQHLGQAGYARGLLER